MARKAEGFVPVNANIRTPAVVDIDVNPSGVGAIPAALAPYITVSELGDGVFHQTILTCVDLPLSVADDAGQAQYGGVKVYTFPEGAICSLGAVIAGALTMGVTGTIIDAFTGVVALGTITASTGATLTSTEATWLQSVAMTLAVAKVAAIGAISIATALTEAGARWVDGTGTPAPVFLNVAIADDASHTAGTGKFTGAITLTWVNLGDK